MVSDSESLEDPVSVEISPSLVYLFVLDSSIGFLLMCLITRFKNRDSMFQVFQYVFNVPNMS